MENNQSFVHFKNGRVVKGTNNGMELLGHFLVSQVGGKPDFFLEWLKHPEEGEISSGSYVLLKKSNFIELDHLERRMAVPFEISKEQFLHILTSWKGLCNSAAHSVCHPGGYEVMLYRSSDGTRFTFHTCKGEND
ncbi:MAG: hypothetical protein WBQ73_01875 [Candidatus Babeliales bacterium]